MMDTQTKQIAGVAAAAVLLGTACFGLLLVSITHAEEVTTTAPTTVDITDLETQIREQQAKLDEIQEKQKVYESTIAQKKQEILSLNNQIEVLDTQIANTDLEMQKKEIEAKKLDLEIEELETEIGKKEADIKTERARLAEFVRLYYRQQQQTPLETFLLNDTFSAFYNELHAMETLQVKAQKSLVALKDMKEEFEGKKDDQEKKKVAAEQAKRQLGIERSNYQGQQDYRAGLLTDTKESQSTYEQLLEESKQEQLNASAEIQRIEAAVRQRLQGTDQLPVFSSNGFIWPVDSRRITSYFHDPNYIFRHYFAHPAIDIGTPQGTPLRAPASGYVGRAVNAGLGYSYIMLVHGNDLSTVFGHVSQISVSENDFVAQGQVIGYSGGTPGTQGAGRLTTGPHLHFEVRLNGIPVDPLGYLP